MRDNVLRAWALLPLGESDNIGNFNRLRNSAFFDGEIVMSEIFSKKMIDGLVCEFLPNEVLFAMGNSDRIECASIWINKLIKENATLEENTKYFLSTKPNDKNRFKDWGPDQLKGYIEGLEDLHKLENERLKKEKSVSHKTLAVMTENREVKKLLKFFYLKSSGVICLCPNPDSHGCHDCKNTGFLSSDNKLIEAMQDALLILRDDSTSSSIGVKDA